MKNLHRAPQNLDRTPFDEWPTWVVIAAAYGSWLMTLRAAGQLGPILSTALLVIEVAWFMSIQHELLHGHPTRSKAVNRLLGLAPLAVWYPYDLYRQTHLAHHRDEILTAPGLDPESNYLAEADFRRLPRWCQSLWVAQRTVVGRALLGPALIIVPTWLDIARKPLRGDFTQSRDWLQHLVLLAAMFWFIESVAGINPLRYALTVGYPALGLAMLRSFYEHRPAERVAHRVVVNEAGWFWRMLYLNNNFHAVHHEQPGLAWHRIRHVYLSERSAVLARNGGFLIPGYLWLLRRHAFTPIDSPVHPTQDAR